MEDALIIGGIVIAFLLLRKGSVTATVSAPGDNTLASGAGLVSGGYQVLPASTQLATGAVSPGSLPSYIPPPPVAAPPPPYYGGTGGTVGSGGTGLGGPVVAGVSTGTATTIRVQPRSAAVVAARAAGLTVTGPNTRIVVG